MLLMLFAILLDCVSQNDTTKVINGNYGMTSQALFYCTSTRLLFSFLRRYITGACFNQVFRGLK